MSHLNMLRGLPEECSDVDGLITEVPDGLHARGVLLAQVLEVLVCGLVLGVVHLDGAGVDELRGEVLHLGGELQQVAGPLLGPRVGERHDVGSLGQAARELLQPVALLLHKLPLPCHGFLGQHSVRKLFEGTGNR